VRVAAAGHGKRPLDVCQRRQGVVEPREDTGVVDDLNTVERQVGHKLRDRSVASDGSAHRMERMRGNGEASLRMDERDRVGGGEMRRDALLKIEADQVAIERADLFADDDVDAEVRIGTGEPARFESAMDLVVISHGEHIEVPSCRADERIRPLSPVAPGGVDVQVRAAGGKAAPPPPPWHAPNPRAGSEASGCRDTRDHLRPACPTSVYGSARGRVTFA